MKRTFVIGDIHGCYSELLTLLHQTGITDEDLLISVGDLIDRGNNSTAVWQYFMQRPNTIVLMGNHERKHLHGILNYAQEIVKVQMGPLYPQFLKWVSTLPYYHETPEAIIVHAALEHDLPLHAQREDVLSGSTSGERHLEKVYPDYWNSHYTGSKPVIYGHSVTGDQPRILNNTYGIDTGACHGGFLTAIELPGFHIHQVKVAHDHWKEQQASWQIPVLKSKDWENMDIATIHQQLAKLAYIEDIKVKSYLRSLQVWLEELDLSLPIIVEKLTAFAAQLPVKQYSQYPFKTFLYKCKNGRLTVEDLRKSLHTPARINQLHTAIDPSAGV